MGNARNSGLGMLETLTDQLQDGMHRQTKSEGVAPATGGGAGKAAPAIRHDRSRGTS